MKATWMTWWCDLTSRWPFGTQTWQSIYKTLDWSMVFPAKTSIYRNCPIVFVFFHIFHYFPLCSMIVPYVLLFSIVFLYLPIFSNMGMGQNPIPLVNIKIAGKLVTAHIVGAPSWAARWGAQFPVVFSDTLWLFNIINWYGKWTNWLWC